MAILDYKFSNLENAMKHIFCIGILLIYFQDLQSKDLTYFEIIDSSTIKIHLDCSGYICPKSYSSFTRITTLNKHSLVFEGKCIDVSSNGDTVFMGNFVQDNLEGRAKYFYSNGIIAEEGFYKLNKRDSIWKYYYENGNLKKTVTYKNGTPYFNEFYKKDGKLLVLNGNGYYKDYIYADNGTCKLSAIQGNLKNSQMDGKWELYDATEYFKQGLFIKGIDMFKYRDNPRLNLEQLTGFYWQENVFILKNYIAGPDSYLDVTWALKTEDTMKSYCLSQFTNSILTTLSTIQKRNYWIMVQFDIDEEGNAHNIETYSYVDQLYQKEIENSVKNTKWKLENKLKEKSTKMYFPVVVKNRVLFIPETQINYCRPDYNFMEEKLRATMVKQ